MRVVYCPTCAWVYPGNAESMPPIPKCRCGGSLAMIVSNTRKGFVDRLKELTIPLQPFIGSLRDEEEDE